MKGCDGPFLVTVYPLCCPAPIVSRAWCSGYAAGDRVVVHGLFRVGADALALLRERRRDCRVSERLQPKRVQHGSGKLLRVRDER